MVVKLEEMENKIKGRYSVKTMRDLEESHKRKRTYDNAMKSKKEGVHISSISYCISLGVLLINVLLDNPLKNKILLQKMQFLKFSTIIFYEYVYPLLPYL